MVLCWRWISLLWVGLLSCAFAQDIVDADGDKVSLHHPQKITVCFYSNESLQKHTRQVARSLDRWQGHSRYRQVIVVDLRDSWGRVFKDIALAQMRRELDKEAERVKAFYETNGNFGNPRAELIVVPDFDGVVCSQLGWEQAPVEQEAIGLNERGETIWQWRMDEGVESLNNKVRQGLFP